MTEGCQRPREGSIPVASPLHRESPTLGEEEARSSLASPIDEDNSSLTKPDSLERLKGFWRNMNSPKPLDSYSSCRSSYPDIITIFAGGLTYLTRRTSSSMDTLPGMIASVISRSGLRPASTKTMAASAVAALLTENPVEPSTRLIIAKSSS